MFPEVKGRGLHLPCDLRENQGFQRPKEEVYLFLVTLEEPRFPEVK